MERKLSQPKKIKWTTRGDGNYTTSESSDDELMEIIGKECIMKCKKSLNANEAANEELDVVQQDKATITLQGTARPLLRAPWQAKSVCKSKAVQQSKIRPLFRVPRQEKTVSQVKAEQQGKALSLFQVSWQTKTVQQGEPGPLLQASQKNPTFNEAIKEENVIVEQDKEEMVPEDDYIVQTHNKNLGNHLNMFDQKFQKDADVRQNLMKDIQELRNQKKKEKSNQE